MVALTVADGLLGLSSIHFTLLAQGRDIYRYPIPPPPTLAPPLPPIVSFLVVNAVSFTHVFVPNFVFRIYKRDAE